MTTAKDLNDLSTIYLEAVYGGEKKKEEKKDTQYVVTRADIQGGTRAAKELAKGNPRYKKADHLKNSYEPEGEVIEDYDLVQKQRRQDAEARKHVAGKEKRREAVSKVKNVAKSFLGKKKKETEVDEAFKALTPEKKRQIKGQADRRYQRANQDRENREYDDASEKDRQTRNMKKVLNNEVDLDFVNSLIESGKFTEEEIKSIIWDEYYYEGAVGQVAGSVAGGALGSVAGPVGTAIGSMAGGAIGGKLLNGGGKVTRLKKGKESNKIKTEEVVRGTSTNAAGEKIPSKVTTEEEDYNYVTEYAAALGALAKGAGAAAQGVGRAAVRQGIKVGGKAGGRAVQQVGTAAKDAAIDAAKERAGEAAGNVVRNIGRKKPEPETDDVEEGYQRNPERGEKEEEERSKNVPGERTPMPPRGDKRREAFEKWYREQGM